MICEGQPPKFHTRWQVTTQIWVVLWCLISVIKHHFAGKLVVMSQRVGCKPTPPAIFSEGKMWTAVGNQALAILTVKPISLRSKWQMTTNKCFDYKYMYNLQVQSQVHMKVQLKVVGLTQNSYLMTPACLQISPAPKCTRILFWVLQSMYLFSWEVLLYKALPRETKW